MGKVFRITAVPDFKHLILHKNGSGHGFGVPSFVDKEEGLLWGLNRGSNCLSKGVVTNQAAITNKVTCIDILVEMAKNNGGNRCR